MLINVSEGEECRIALVEDGALQELYMERTSSTSHVGNVYKGKVMNVEASIQAAFVDFGLGRNGFLHISDLLPSYFGRKGDDVQEFVGKKMARRDRPPWNQHLRSPLDHHRAEAAPRRLEQWAMTLLKWALIFFLVSVVAGVFGFTGISAASADVARFLFYVFVVIFLVLLILGLTIFRA